MFYMIQEIWILRDNSDKFRFEIVPPDGHKKIRAHLVFDVKHDGCHKACYIAGGHLTNIPNASVYSG